VPWNGTVKDFQGVERPCVGCLDATAYWLSHRTALLRWIWRWSAPKESGLIGKLVVASKESRCGKFGRRCRMPSHEGCADREGKKTYTGDIGPDAIEKESEVWAASEKHICADIIVGAD